MESRRQKQWRNSALRGLLCFSLPTGLIWNACATVNDSPDGSYALIAAVNRDHAACIRLLLNAGVSLSTDERQSLLSQLSDTGKGHSLSATYLRKAGKIP